MLLTMRMNLTNPHPEERRSRVSKDVVITRSHVGVVRHAMLRIAAHNEVKNSLLTNAYCLMPLTLILSSREAACRRTG